MSKGISGRFEWNELWTLDPTAASSFYTKILPWTAQLWDAETGYTIFMGGGISEAGCHKLAAQDSGPHIKPRWNTYISADDVDAKVSQALKLGAKLIVPAMEIPRVGRFAMLSDPQGAAFGLLCRSVVEPPRAMPRPSGAIVWNELLSTDAEAGFRFYAEIFGWELVTSIDMGPKGKYLVFGDHGQQRGGMMTVALPGGPQWLPYAEVADADETAKLAVQAGATLCLGPMTITGGGRIANFLDPQGVLFAVHSMTAAVQANAAPASAAKKPTPARRKAAAPAAARTGAIPSKTKPRNKRAKPALVKKAAKKKAAKKKSAAPRRKAKSSKTTPKRSSPSRKKSGRKVTRSAAKQGRKQVKRTQSKRSARSKARRR